jgi:RimJ/RimL family protein N-acetyltransferase
MAKVDNTVKTRILTKIQELKHASFGKVVIDCNFNNLRYSLVLLTADCSNNKDLMELIARWRKENEMWFADQFKVTTEGTIKWFKEKVIETPDRLLFIIKVHNDYIGHVGLFRFDFESITCEIDNIVRGEPQYPGIMGNAIIHMMNWGKTILELKGYSLKVLSDNERAMRLYKRLGFVEAKRIPLVCIRGDDRVEWIEAPNGYNQMIERYYIVMILSKENKNIRD